MDLEIRREFLSKIKRFQKVKSVDLHVAYLDLVYELYIHPETTDKERTEVLRPNVLYGLSSRDSTMRLKFFKYVVLLSIG